MFCAGRPGLEMHWRVEETQLQRFSFGVGGRDTAASQTFSVGEGQGGAELLGVYDDSTARVGEIAANCEERAV